MSQSSETETIIGRLVAGTERTIIPIPLKKTSIQGQVIGPLASITVSQVFANPLTEAAEMDYLFPLPENAAIVDFELRIGERTISAKIDELDQARRTYEEASQQGKRAGLFEQRRPNLFAVRLANVLPGETVQTKLQYQARIKFEDGAFELVFPMGLTPRYSTAEAPEEALATDFPVAEPGVEAGKVEISLMVDAGVPVNEPSSPTHPLKIARIDSRRFQVSLEGEHIPDHDFVLRYTLAGQNLALGAWSSHDDSGDYLLAAVFPPALPEDFQAPRREFIFVLDRSGSMSGEPIKQARNALRACLRTLNEGDAFRILLFDNEVDWFNKAASKITQADIDRADSFLEQVQGRGGTEILKALEAVFNLTRDGERPRYIVFLTDGAVSAEERALQQIRSKLGKAHLFTFGIGPSVNRAFLSQMARLGRGTAEFLQLDEDIEGAIIRFQDRVSFPVLTDLAVSWEGARAWDIYPSWLPDLYAGQPLEICCRFQPSQSNPVLVLSGKRDGKPAKLRVELAPEKVNGEAVLRVWCRARVDDLLEQMASHPEETARVRNEIIGLALQSRLVTPFTAFVAVDQETSTADPGKRKLIHVAQPLPKGLDRAGFERPPMHPPQQPGIYLASTAPRGGIQAKSMSEQTPGAFMGMDLPAFLRKKGGPKIDEPSDVKVEEGMPASGEEVLRWLARTQEVDGSWDQDDERTSAALLAFVRHGHTTRTGSYRQTVRRAFTWLESKTNWAGSAAFVRCLALHELARVTSQPVHLAAAQAARSALPEANTALEKVITQLMDGTGMGNVSLPAQVTTLDELRLEAIVKGKSGVHPDLITGADAGLARTWMAVLLER